MVALYNEKTIFKELVKKYNLNIEKSKPGVVFGELNVSVDFIWKEKDLTFLFEIDSYNAAKIIFGEYVLLNQVKAYKSNCILVIIHCYKNYNVKRTEKYLDYAVGALKCKLPYVVFSNSEWSEIVKIKSKVGLINLIKKRSKTEN